MKRVLITGAAGFIGSRVADALLERGDEVIALDNFNSQYDPRIKRDNIFGAVAHGNYRLYEEDICDEKHVMEIFRKEYPEAVIHLAAATGVRNSFQDPRLYYHVNVIGTQVILDTCRTYCPSHVVLASSSTVYDDADIPFTEDKSAVHPLSPYAVSKRTNELMAGFYSRVYNMNITVLRIFTACGPRQRPDMAVHTFTRLIDEGEPVPIFGDGSARRDYTYIDDVVDGIVRAVDKPFRYEIINLGEQDTTSLDELVRLISKNLGKSARINYVPLQPGDLNMSCADIRKARELLGYSPRYPINQCIQCFVEWYTSRRIHLPKKQ